MSDKTTETIKKNIKHYLKIIGENQTWLANEAGIQSGHMSELMNGKKRWNTTTLDIVSKTLNIDTGALMVESTIDPWAQEHLDALKGFDEAERKHYDEGMKFLFPDKFKKDE